MVILCTEPYTAELPEEFPFPLSDFQKYAIEGIIKGNHVLVTAHTGSGKTLPAEFAIRHFTRIGKKVIYTSPIKALSNQKFYEFSRKYPEISFGLLTGDIKTNPTAQVLIMTTEILMNYLFSMTDASTPLDFQIDIDSELGCVVFDEVHYINDAERGQTWEQTILMLPPKIQMVLLSATMDNPEGFAEWIECRPGSVPVYLASTDHRVVPLTHYGFFATTETPFKNNPEIRLDKETKEIIRTSTNKLIMLRTAEGKFVDAGYYELKKMSDLFTKHRFYMKRKFVLNKLAEHLRIEEMLPAIVFVFSRKSVEQCAHDITTNLLEDDSKVPYIMAQECEQIVRKFPNFKEYLELPEYVSLVKLLEKGIGIHHSGMIPVLREIVEIMISKKYIKLLFATESFAIGLDCPIRTAVFSALRKYDGHHIRDLLPHEYTQMAGRAGRRGIDVIGHVIHCNNLFDLPPIQDYKGILCGRPQTLISKFRISYPTALNLIKTGSQSFDEFVDRSMLKKELDQSAISTKSAVEDLRTRIQRELFMRTPEEVCREYIHMEDHISMYKKKKEWERKMKDMKDEHRWLIEDIKKIREHDVLKTEFKKAEEELEYISKYSQIHTNQIFDILFKYGFITENREFTVCGKIAANLHEIHPLIGSHLFEFFRENPPTVKHILILFSLFADLRVPEETRRIYPKTDDLYLRDAIQNVENWIEQYATEELKHGTYTGIVYDNLIQFDLIHEISEWVDCETEQQCKFFIQTTLGERDISVGDFTKAILKILVITKEFASICETFENLPLLSLLRELEPLICKYIATSQSLYV